MLGLSHLRTRLTSYPRYKCSSLDESLLQPEAEEELGSCEQNCSFTWAGSSGYREAVNGRARFSLTSGYPASGSS